MVAAQPEPEKTDHMERADRILALEELLEARGQDDRIAALEGQLSSGSSPQPKKRAAKTKKQNKGCC